MKNLGGIPGSCPTGQAPAGLDAPRCDPGRVAVARCIEIARQVRDEFLSEDYATDQPLSSLNERFACDQVAQAIENEFGMGTIEQCHLLGKPTPFELHRASQGGE